MRTFNEFVNPQTKAQWEHLKAAQDLTPDLIQLLSQMGSINEALKAFIQEHRPDLVPLVKES
jgi:hypothetical protein